MFMLLLKYIGNPDFFVCFFDLLCFISGFWFFLKYIVKRFYRFAFLKGERRLGILFPIND